MSSDGSSLLFRSAPRGLDRKAIRAFLATLTVEVAGSREFTCLITSDAELRRLNRDFLGKDYPTDVLSFPALEGEEALGEMAISAPRARVQAEEFGHTVETEIHVLMLHGLLHLLGHDHETDRGAMRRLETKWRKKFGLPSGLIERAKR